MSKSFYVYILASRSRNLYTGVTNNLRRRMVEHREKRVPGFSLRYNIFRLVHFEVFGGIGVAIRREKEIKAWRREKKIRLIERNNPTWEDLAAEWYAGRQRQRAELAAMEEGTTEEKAKAEAKAEADPSHRPRTPRTGSG
jgi:putative endonuclease